MGNESPSRTIEEINAETQKINKETEEINEEAEKIENRNNKNYKILKKAAEVFLEGIKKI